MKKHVEKFMRGYSGAVLVGLSGGADSVALAHVLVSLGRGVYAVHVNHHMRGNADADELFVRDFCRKFSVLLVVKHVELDRASEENARDARYAAFAAALTETGAAHIATAHTMDDQAETVLMNLCRGAGLAGLAGIPAVRGDIIRPLLAVSRAEVENYLRENALEYVTDETNASDKYTRNRVRKYILPALHQHVNAQAARNIARAAERLAQAVPHSDRLYTAQAPPVPPPFPDVCISHGPPERGYTCAAKCGTLEEPVLVRRWQPGDRMTLARGDGTLFTKKLQDIFVDDKIPRHMRESIPVITSAGEIAAVLGPRPRIAAKFAGETTYMNIGG